MKRKTTRLLVILALVFTLILPSFSVGATPPEPSQFFDTVADMLAASLTVGTAVSTGGFYELGDGGEGIYDIFSSGVADNYLSFKAANQTIAKLRAENGGINVLQAGAKGDGITDDTKAINAATMSEYESVYFPRGIYIVKPWVHPNGGNRKTAIVLGRRGKEGINLYGHGMDETVLKVADNSATTTVLPNGEIIYDNYDSVISGWNPYLSDVTLRDFTIDQNVQNNNTVPVEGGKGTANYNKLYCIKSTLERVKIHQVEFKHQGSNAIFAADSRESEQHERRGRGYEIDTCLFEFDMHRDTITNYDNSALYCVGRDFKVHHNTIITKLNFNTEINDIKGYTSQIYGLGGIEIHGGNAQVYNNSIDDYYVGIHYQGREDYNDLGSQVYNNWISRAQIGLSIGADPGITELSGARIFDNKIKISFAYKKGFRNSAPIPSGVRVSSTELEIEDIEFVNNTITYDRSTLIPGHTYHFDEHSGILLRGSRTEKILIEGNTIENAPGLGMLLNRNNSDIIAKDFLVENNQFKNCGWSTDLGYSSIGNTIGRRTAIAVYRSLGNGEISNIIIRGNKFEDDSQYGECLYSIIAPKSLVTSGAIVLQNNIEESVSGKGFYTPQFENLADQVYPRIPTDLDVNAFPTDGTFYRGQKVQVKDGEEVVSTWFITSSGVIGKEIPEGSKTGTILDGHSIRMNNSGHGIQSGDIINIRTTDGQEQTNIWVGGVTDQILYTEQQVNLTGEVTVSYFRASYIEENGTVVFSAIPEEPSVIRNEAFYATVKTHKDVQNIMLFSESGGYV